MFEPHVYPPMRPNERDALRVQVQQLLLGACTEIYRRDPRDVVGGLIEDLAIVLIGPLEVQ